MTPGLDPASVFVGIGLGMFLYLLLYVGGEPPRGQA